jgi:hypothetical protein
MPSGSHERVRSDRLSDFGGCLTPTEASTAGVVTAYRQLQNIEHRFRVLTDFLHLRPVRHWTEQRGSPR